MKLFWFHINIFFSNLHFSFKYLFCLVSVEFIINMQSFFNIYKIELFKGSRIEYSFKISPVSLIISDYSDLFT